MIEYLTILLILKLYEEHAVRAAANDDIERCLDVGAGLDFEPQHRKRPDLKVVK